MWTGDEVILPAKPPSPPPHVFTPDTPGRDVDSDELSFAKWRRSPSAERKKKKKSGLKHAITPEQMLYARQAKEKVPYQKDPASSGMESPSTAFAATVNKSTGYSPLNPTVPLQAAFQDLTPSFVMQAPFASPNSTAGNASEWFARMRAKEQVNRTNPPSPVQTQPSTSSSEEVATDRRTPRIKGIRTSRTTSPAVSASTFPTSSPTAEIPLNPTPPVTTPSPLAEKPIIFAASTPPVAATTPWVETPIIPARPSFDAARPALFQRAFFDSIRGVRFDDTHVYVYAARSRAGVAHRPRVVHARSDFLKAASAVFEDGLYDGCVVDPGSVTARRASRMEYGYDCDSDLEDDEEDTVVEPTQAKETVPVSSTETAKAAQTGTEATPKSSTLSVTDLDVMSLDDFKSDHSTSDATEEATRTLVAATNGNSTADPARTPSKPSLSLATNDAVLNWRAAQEKLTAVPAERAVEAPPAQVSKETTAQGADGAAADGRASVRDMRERTLFIPDSAHRTWQALLLYLYNDYLEFAPLRSQRRATGAVQPSVSDAPTCSPKSMYRLATKLGLDILRDQSFTALKQALSRENIVEELFSDFTWRYPEVLKMETEIFHRYSSDAAVQTAMAEKFQEIAYGQLPHSSIVLNSLFMRFIGGGLPSLTGPPRSK